MIEGFQTIITCGMNSRFLTKGILSTMVLTLLCLSLSAQSFYKERVPKTDIWSIGIGTSFIYADNGGQYRSFNFEWNPAVTLSYTKRFHPHWGLQTSVGAQIIESGGNPSRQVQEHWRQQGSSFRFEGTAFYADAMPILYVFPYVSHMNRPYVNLYGGLGLGIMHVNRSQYMSFDQDEPRISASTSTGYVPFRAGIVFRLDNVSDIALEGTMLFTFSDNLEGNTNFNRFGDHLAQAQITYKRYFAKRRR